MAKFSINLLPPESANITKEIRRRKLVQTISVTTLLIMFFFSSLVITLRFLQSRNINEVGSKSQEQENKISGFRSKESSLVLLKDRLTIISKLTNSPSKQKMIYDAIVSSIPADISVSSMTLDAAGNLSISAAADNVNSLTNFFAIFSSDELFKISSGVNVESLSRSRDGLYKTSVKILAIK